MKHFATTAFAPILLVTLIVGVAWSQTPDDQLDDFLAAKQDAYRYYRSAWFYIRTGNVDLAALELSFFIEGWNEIRLRFTAEPPGPYADDPLWHEELAEIADLAAAGMAALEVPDPEVAKASLAAIPRIMASMRARNGIVTFSDSVDNLTQAVDGLWRYRHQPADFKDPSTRTELDEGAEQLRDAFDRLRDEAPDEVAFDERFLRLVSDSDAAVERLEQAITTEDQTDLVNALRELRSFERLLWLNFG